MPIWYEKTVEYLFVAQAMRDNEDCFLGPLSGKTEGQGDLQFLSDTRYGLVEFKKTLDITSEYKNFNGDQAGYDRAKKDPTISKHTEKPFHWLVAAEAATEITIPSDVATFIEDKIKDTVKTKPIFQLVAAPYFYIENSQKDSVTYTVLSSGVELEEFNKYVKEFLKYRKNRGPDDGDDSQWTNSLVLAIGPNGQHMAIPVGQWVTSHNLKLKQRNQPSP